MEGKTESWERQYRFYVRCGYAVVAMMSIAAVVVTYLLQYVYPDFKGTLTDIASSRGYTVFYILSLVIVVMGGIITRSSPRRDMYRLKLQTGAAFAFSIGMFTAGCMMTFLLGDGTLIYTATAFAVLMLFIFFPGSEKWEAVGKGLDEMRRKPLGELEDEVSDVFKRRFREEGDRITISRFDPSAGKKVIIPVLLMFIIVCMMIYLRFRQMEAWGDDVAALRQRMIFIIMVPLLMCLNVVFIMFFRKAVEFDRKRRIMNDYFQWFSFRRDNVTDLGDFDRIVMTRMHGGRVFEVRLEGPEGSKIICQTVHEADARWLLNKLSVFLSLEARM